MNSNRRIMIVDDEAYNILAMKLIINNSQNNDLSGIIDIANNGLQALNLVKDAVISKKHSYGLILMDCSMPIMDGYTASKMIR